MLISRSRRVALAVCAIAARVRRRQFEFFGSLMLASAVFTGCSRQTELPPAPPIEVVAGNPVKTPIVEWDEYVGRLEAIEFVEVRARVSGYLDAIYYDEGQLVREGDLLCIIDPRPFEAEANLAAASLSEAQSQVEQAQASEREVEAELKVAQSRLDLAKTLLVRAQALLAKQAIPEQDVDIRQSEQNQAQATVEATSARLALARTATISARSAQEAAEARLELAQLNLGYTRIRAPISGRIGAREVTKGNIISGGVGQSTLITTIVSLDPIHCYFDADEQAYLKYQRLEQGPGGSAAATGKNPIFVGLTDEPDEFPHRGHLDFFDNRMDAETGTMRGQAILPNPNFELTPGLFARLRIPGSPRYDAVLIPDMAIGADQSEKFVLLVNDQGKVERRNITVGPAVRNLRVVREGLNGTERMILRGLQRVRPGVDVVVKNEAIALDDGGLPNDFDRVPKEQWLSQPRSLSRPAHDAEIARHTASDELPRPVNRPN